VAARVHGVGWDVPMGHSWGSNINCVICKRTKFVHQVMYTFIPRIKNKPRSVQSVPLSIALPGATTPKHQYLYAQQI
jgi:hypothetical protein